MNRRELLKRGFELGAAGLMLPMVEPIRRYWSLDRTMIHLPRKPEHDWGSHSFIETGRFDFSMPTQWKLTDFCAEVIIDGERRIIPLEQTSHNEWNFIAPSDGVIAGYRYIKSPYAAAEYPESSSTLR